MATLQVKEMLDFLYDSIKELAKRDHRSISQQVTAILTQFVMRKQSVSQTPTDDFLELCGNWDDPRSAEQMVAELRQSRENSSRFEGQYGLLD